MEKVEGLARKRAEKKAMQEAMANNVVVWFPLLFIAVILMLGGAPILFAVFFTTVALVAGMVAAILTWKSAYEKYYKKYLAELKEA